MSTIASALAGPRHGALGRRLTALLPDAVLVAALLASAGLAVVSSSPVLAAAAIGLLGVTGAAWAGTRAHPDERATIALSALLTLVLAVPVTRLSSPGLPILAMSAASALLLLAAARRPLPRGAGLLLAFLAVLGTATALSPDSLALLRFAPLVVSVVPCFVLYGRLPDGSRRRVERVLLSLAVTEALLSIAETFVLRSHLWSAGGQGASGAARDLLNPLYPALERAQATLGHPLPFAILLTVALALLFRRFAGAPFVVKALVAAVLLTGLALSGSRNALLAAAVILLFFSTSRLRGFQVVLGSAVLAFLAIATAVLGLVSVDVSQGFLASGSVTHRVGAYEAVPGLLTGQPLVNTLLGNGFASTGRIFLTGLLQNDGLAAVDNQWVSTLSQGGMVAVVLLAALAVVALVRAGPAYRPALLALLYTTFIFDVLNWPSSAMLVAIVLAAAWNPGAPGLRAVTPGRLPGGRRSRV